MKVMRCNFAGVSIMQTFLIFDTLSVDMGEVAVHYVGPT